MVEIVARWEHKTKEEAEEKYKKELMAWIPGYMETRDETV